MTLLKTEVCLYLHHDSAYLSIRVQVLESRKLNAKKYFHQENLSLYPFSFALVHWYYYFILYYY